MLVFERTCQTEQQQPQRRRQRRLRRRQQQRKQQQQQQQQQRQQRRRQTEHNAYVRQHYNSYQRKVYCSIEIGGCRHRTDSRQTPARGYCTSGTRLARRFRT